MTNTTQNQQPVRGQVIPYADQRAYTDRLNALLTPAGWTRRYTVHTSSNFERAKDKRIVAKVLVTCELTIFGLGSHSATGEEWADNDNAGTAAEAQAFKRACSCFGLGRYLYYFTGAWVDLDERKRSKNIPRLLGWATPQGWREGLRPGQEAKSASSDPKPARDVRDVNSEDASALVRQISEMSEPLGWRLYRGLLRTGARVWNPTQIRDANVLRKVLAQMQSAERGLRRLDAALNRVGPEALVPILRSLRLNSLAQVNNLETLKRVVHEVERAISQQLTRRYQVFCAETFRVFEQLDDVVNDIVNFAAANDAPGLEGKYPFNELLRSFEVHYPIRFPCFSIIG